LNTFKRKIKGVIFDLDGTLINSIEDIKDSLNHILKTHDHPIITTKKCSALVGHGLFDLVKHSVPEEFREKPYLDLLVSEMREEYTTRWLDKTALYDGVDEMLNQLSKRKYVFAVLSNKVQTSTQTLVSQLLSNWHFSVVAGAIPERPLKPHPASIRFVLDELGLQADEVIFVGDGDADVLAAQSISMKVIAVSWGYRTKQSLSALSPDYMIDHPNQILDILL